jgi:uncharacterized protein (TIGR02996 family)
LNDWNVRATFPELKPMTPDEIAFIASIKANPEDDMPRLVFADWLEENGQSERAEFIRVSIEAMRVFNSGDHNGEVSPENCVTCQKYDALRKREKELRRDDYGWQIEHFGHPWC